MNSQFKIAEEDRSFTESESSSSWHRSLSEAIRDPAELIERLGLDSSLLPAGRRASREFPVLVPESYLARMTAGDCDDPLLLQVLPVEDELREFPGFVSDAVDDASFRRSPGLLHKYSGRALLITTGSCAVHCRYCFRRDYAYGDEPRRLADWQPAFDELASDESISEILLSGGDPLMLTDQRLHDIIARLERIPHLRRLRIHSRLPIVLPDRVTSELISILTSRCDRNARLTPIVVVHANHAAEIVDDCADALRRLVGSGITVLNQSVLLRGVNDSVDALCNLSESLIDLGVIPYYLHQLDRVAGAAHFEVPLPDGAALVREMRKRLPGYAVPRYVQEIPGEPHKTVIE